MDFVKNLKEKAKASNKSIVLPETEDERILEGAMRIVEEEIAKVILLGDAQKITRKYSQLKNVEIIDPENSRKAEDYANLLYDLRKHKGMTIENARELVKDSVWYGTLMVKSKDADGMVAGALKSTADIFRPAFQIVKTAPGIGVVSSAFIMVLPDHSFGNNGVLLFADCAINPNPNKEQLAEIAISSANTWKALIGGEPKVAMLSFSTKGSAKHELIDKVVEATKMVQENHPDLAIDGELQLDAALVPSVAKKKAPESKVAGDANILVFPDLGAGNIGYKLVQRLAKAEAIGPISQGLAAPINDLSRGCSIEDVVNVVAITALQANI